MVCRFRDAVCRRCERKGHIAKVCRAPQPVKPGPLVPASNKDCFRPRRGAKMGDRAKSPAESADACRIKVKANACQSAKKIYVSVMVRGKPCRMEVDSGSTISIISWATLKKLLPDVKRSQLSQQKLQIRDYQGNRLLVLGLIDLQMTFKHFNGQLPVTVVVEQLPSLLGLEWFDPLGLEVTGVHATMTSWGLDLIDEYKDVFSENLGDYSQSDQPDLEPFRPWASTREPSTPSEPEPSEQVPAAPELARSEPQRSGRPSKKPGYLD